MPLYPSRVMGGDRDTLAGVPFSLEDQEEKGRQTHPSLSVSLALCLCRPPWRVKGVGVIGTHPVGPFPMPCPLLEHGQGGGGEGGHVEHPWGCLFSERNRDNHTTFLFASFVPPIEEDKGGGHRIYTHTGKALSHESRG